MILSYTLQASARAAGWRKALALGAAGLAGLAPMKARGQEAPSTGAQEQVVEIGGLDVYRQASYRSPVLTHIKQGELVTVQDDEPSGWSQIKTNAGIVGWVHGKEGPIGDMPLISPGDDVARQIGEEQQAQQAASEEPQEYAEPHDIGTARIPTWDQLDTAAMERKAMFVRDPDGWTNIRKGPSAKSEVLAHVDNDKQVEVLNKQGDWYQVMTVAATPVVGYIHKSRLAKQPSR